jgi:hypothetical protein
VTESQLAIGSLGFSDTQNRAVADVALASLTDAPGLELVEPQSLDPVLRELQISLSGLVRAKKAHAVRELLQIDWFLFDTQFVLGGSNSIILRIVDARTGVYEAADLQVELLLKLENSWVKEK